MKDDDCIGVTTKEIHLQSHNFMDRLVADIPIKTPVTSAVKKQKRKKRKKVSVLYMLGTSNITLSL